MPVHKGAGHQAAVYSKQDLTVTWLSHTAWNNSTRQEIWIRSYLPERGRWYNEAIDLRGHC
ncbi:hypothetical protein [Chitinophaga filiformis]|uniref:Uncharacterized protein n=1 Tax=Chitinophaga filiformis TaxID=104663 RepID=A0ABY4HUE8_CHIFI|nr:hypothetical protein [Chitinophaga filiformis]UPK67152.1 hypothetical protein MYF79_19625 [Chitinophaga filiformis]